MQLLIPYFALDNTVTNPFFLANAFITVHSYRLVKHHSMRRCFHVAVLLSALAATSSIGPCPHTPIRECFDLVWAECYVPGSRCIPTECMRARAKELCDLPCQRRARRMYLD